MRVNSKRRLGKKTKEWAKEMAEKYNVTAEDVENMWRDLDVITNYNTRKRKIEQLLPLMPKKETRSV